MAAKRSGVGGRLTRKLGPAPVWAWALVLLAGAFLAYRHFRTSSVGVAAQPQPVTSAAASDQSAAQQPSGGAASVPGQLPAILASQPDPLTAQVQLADTSAGAAGAQAPTMQSYPGPIAPQGTTLTYGGVTYDVSGQANVGTAAAPNYNPNSPAGVIAYNNWIAGGGAPTQPAPVSTQTPVQSMIAAHYAAGRDPGV